MNYYIRYQWVYNGLNTSLRFFQEALKDISSLFYVRILPKWWLISSMIMVACLRIDGAPLTISITQGNVRPIALVMFPFSSSGESDAAQTVRDVIIQDVCLWSRFRHVHPLPTMVPTMHDEALRRKGVEATIIGHVIKGAKGVSVIITLQNLISQKKLMDRQKFEGRSVRQVAHRVADAIHRCMTGESGDFDSHIVFISQFGPRGRKKQALSLMDSDGGNVYQLTPYQKSVLATPCLAPDRRSVAYVSYERNIPSIFIFNLEKGKRKHLHRSKDNLSAPRFTRDGKALLFHVSAPDMLSSLHLYTLENKHITPVWTARSRSICTSPSFSPLGDRMVVNSDHEGSPQLYLWRVGSPLERLSSAGGSSCFSPSWSPKGDEIAFVRTESGMFHLAVLNLATRQEKLLLTYYIIDKPCWSPSGRRLLFCAQSGLDAPRKLFVYDCLTQNLKELKTPQEGSDPHWV